MILRRMLLLVLGQELILVLQVLLGVHATPAHRLPPHLRNLRLWSAPRIISTAGTRERLLEHIVAVPALARQVVKRVASARGRCSVVEVRRTAINLRLKRVVLGALLALLSQLLGPFNCSLVIINGQERPHQRGAYMPKPFFYSPIHSGLVATYDQFN